jgi:hypothetical protein
VATDQKTRLIDAGTDQAGSVIENELPAYRAISRLAVFSVIFGLLASFSFAHVFFYLFAIFAVVAGVAANISIKRYPDILTGRGMASAGIAMGLIFGLASGTIATVQDYVRVREAERFARSLVPMFKAHDAAEAMWWGMYPDLRKDKTPIQYLHEFEAAKGKDRMMMEQKLAGLQKIRDRLAAGPKEEVRFVKIETSDVDDAHGTEMGIYALAVFELAGPGSKEFPEKQEFAGALMKARTKGRQYEWWVESYLFPYKPSSFVPTEKPVDDGHGHGH